MDEKAKSVGEEELKLVGWEEKAKNDGKKKTKLVAERGNENGRKE